MMVTLKWNTTTNMSALLLLLLLFRELFLVRQKERETATNLHLLFIIRHLL